ncbi:alpha/beta hydrolase [Amycolatopsis umgeniensis]|uniref:Pimeloyl-ACP methyl ester carboxylesterase n=1 Tax=Amycolatopsis umgeniensis TaxID=336628 RepID=A0A841AVQ0_9PSEU|nr:alpha/beta fold hydrolase [Amycolatopsis umgeniensis]MBB5851057.1 pimeloyl-ACP methyl ester carboxylesterase [Amycolatopsis umgeniensis]
MHWRHGSVKRRAGALTFAILLAGSLLTHAQAQADTASCQDVTIPVRLAGLLPQSVHGKLCEPPGGARTVQVLVPGATYNSVYWDSAHTPETHSFRLAMNKAGYATFAIDRLGTGASSKPPSALLTAFTEADVVHQVIQAIRHGDLGSQFDKVILGGHSLGAAITVLEAGTYRDVDGVLITGLAHRINPPGALVVLGSFIPVALDPVMSRRGLDPTYLTTQPGARYGAFHAPGIDVPGMTAYDEATKDVVAPGELLDAAALATVLPYSRRITVPVLVALGGGDGGLCGPLATDCTSSAGLLQSEAPYYAAAARLRAYVLPGYGHSINYAPNAPDYHQAVTQWADSMGLSR